VGYPTDNVSERDAKFADNADYNWKKCALAERARQLREDFSAAYNAKPAIGLPTALSPTGLGNTLNLAAGNVNYDYDAVPKQFFNVLGNGAGNNKLSLTSAAAFATPLLFWVSCDSTAADVRLNAGAVVTCAASETTMLLCVASDTLTTLSVTS